MSTLRMTEQELAEFHRRVRISKSRQGVSRSKIKLTITSGNPIVKPTYRSKLEATYAAHLDLLVKAGEVNRWEYEPILLKLADDARFRPDFLVVLPGGMERRPELHEVKGRWIKNKRDGITHLKWAAQRYGDVFTFRLIEWNGHGFDGRYVVEP